MALVFPIDFVIREEDPLKSCIFSPNSIFSVFSPLFQTYDEITQQFLKSNFQYEMTDEETAKSINLYDSQLKKETKLFLRKECHLQVETKNNIENNFGCAIDLIDERNLSPGLNWIRENSNDPNCNFFEASSINNVINFNFGWLNSFALHDTTRESFSKTTNDTVQANFMNQEINCSYLNSTELDAKLIELPFSNENVTALIILPNNTTTVSEVEVKLTNFSLERQVSRMQKRLMKVSIPKFKFCSSLDLKNIIKTARFGQPPFKLKTSPSSSISGILTKSCIEMSEFGSKATAASACQLMLETIVKEMLFETTIANRFAKTLITNKVQNVANFPQETTFNIILPENAFISEFVMIINGKSYKSYVKEKEEAKNIYHQAVASGRSAAHVAVSARDSNKFTVSVNIEPNSEITFLLTYEELLQRRYDQYELILNIHPGQLINILKVSIKIDESRNLKYVKTPAIRSGNEIIDEPGDTNVSAKIWTSDSKATITFEPDLEFQKQTARKFKKPELSGFSGQFVVQYDVELDPKNGEVLVSDGYFVHFYAPDDLPALPKHVVFSLDTSGSMGGRKIAQLKDAMNCILDQIKDNDLVDILEFTTYVTVYDIDSQTATRIGYEQEENYQEPFYKYERLNLSTAKPANASIIAKAKSVVNNLQATSSTHIIGGLETALYLVKLGKQEYASHQPMIVFLTDGQPNVGISNTHAIAEIVTKINKENDKSPIFSLSFGEEADKNFLRKLSLNNSGFSRHIYEAADASLQLQQFYKQISCPLLSDVTFNYNSNIEELTRIYFPIYFRGSDMLVCGKYTDFVGPTFINLVCPGGCITLTPVPKQSNASLERLWAYLTIKQLLEQREYSDNKTDLTRKAVNLALKYSFVTEVTSLVVVKPEETATVATEKASWGESSTLFGAHSNFQSPSFAGASFKYSNPGASLFGSSGGFGYTPQSASVSGGSSFGSTSAVGGGGTTFGSGLFGAPPPPTGVGGGFSFSSTSAVGGGGTTCGSGLFGAPPPTGVRGGTAPSYQRLSNNQVAFGSSGGGFTPGLAGQINQQQSNAQVAFGSTGSFVGGGSGNSVLFAQPTLPQINVQGGPMFGSTSLFGQQLSTTQGGPMFGSSNLFGQQPSTVQGGPMFGSTSLFGQQPSTTQGLNLFGQGNQQSLVSASIPMAKATGATFGDVSPVVPASNTTPDDFLFDYFDDDFCEGVSGVSTSNITPAGFTFGVSGSSSQAPTGPSQTHTGLSGFGPQGTSIQEGRDEMDTSVDSTTPIEFKANRPFILMIIAKLERKTVIVFKGRIFEPIFNEK